MATSIKIRFVLTGLNIDPDRITKAIGLAPTRTWRLGDRRGPSDLRYKHDGWMLSTEEKEEIYVDREIENLFRIIKSRKTQISNIVKNLNLDIEIGISIYIEDSQAPTINFNRDIISFSNEIGAEIDIDIYC